MKSFVGPIFSWCLQKQTCGKSNRFQDGGCHESRVQLELKTLVDIHPQSTKSEGTVAVKILIASSSNKFINIHDRANPKSLFSHLTLLGSCRDFSLHSISAVGFLEIDLRQV